MTERTVWPTAIATPLKSARRVAISNGEESVVCSTALLLSFFISADF